MDFTLLHFAALCHCEPLRLKAERRGNLKNRAKLMIEILTVAADAIGAPSE
jgi:hypothetical protein